MDPSNFTKATADFHCARLFFDGVQVEVKRRPCDVKGCPYLAWLVDTDIRDGRRIEIYRCDSDEKHTSIVTRLDS